MKRFWKLAALIVVAAIPLILLAKKGVMKRVGP